jgi:hypothetical protein
MTFSYLQENKLTGTIPNNFADLVLLTSLALHTNQLSGTIHPPLLRNLAALTYLYAFLANVNDKFLTLIHQWIVNEPIVWSDSVGRQPRQLGAVVFVQQQSDGENSRRECFGKRESSGFVKQSTERTNSIGVQHTRWFNSAVRKLPSACLVVAHLSHHSNLQFNQLTGTLHSSLGGIAQL